MSSPESNGGFVANRGTFFSRALLSILVCVLIVSPALEGAFEVDGDPLLTLVVGALVAALLVVVATSFVKRFSLITPIRVAITAIAAVALTVTLADLIGRTVLIGAISVRPENRYVIRWPRLPRIRRLMPNITFEGETYGDLAQISGNPEYREWRHTVFISDEYGFRNIPSQPGPFDTVILGDSYGMGTSNSQEDTLAANLQARGRLVYNLAIDGVSPWAEYVNFATEIDRVNPVPGAVVLWLLFPGNDLYESYGRVDLQSLAWRSPFDQIFVSYETYRSKSPLRQITQRVERRVLEETLYHVSTRNFLNGKPMLFLDEHAREVGPSFEGIQAHSNFPHLVETIDAMDQLTRQRTLRLAIVIVPSKDQIYDWVYRSKPEWTSDTNPSGFSQAVQQIAIEHDICFVDLLPGLIAESERVYQNSGETTFWYDDTHWNPIGEAAAARILTDSLCLQGEVSNFCCEP